MGLILSHTDLFAYKLPAEPKVRQSSPLSWIGSFAFLAILIAWVILQFLRYGAHPKFFSSHTIRRETDFTARANPFGIRLFRDGKMFFNSSHFRWRFRYRTFFYGNSRTSDPRYKKVNVILPTTTCSVYYELTKDFERRLAAMEKQIAFRDSLLLSNEFHCAVSKVVGPLLDERERKPTVTLDEPEAAHDLAIADGKRVCQHERHLVDLDFTQPERVCQHERHLVDLDFSQPERLEEVECWSPCEEADLQAHQQLPFMPEYGCMKWHGNSVASD